MDLRGAFLRKYNSNHDRRGRFSRSNSSGLAPSGGKASSKIRVVSDASVSWDGDLVEQFSREFSETLDSAIGMGKIKTKAIPLELSETHEKHGAFLVDRSGNWPDYFDVPAHINVSSVPGYPSALFTAVHEAWHFIDLVSSSIQGRFGSSDPSRRMENVLSAARESETTRKILDALDDMEDDPEAEVELLSEREGTRTVRGEAKANFIFHMRGYVFSAREVFARAATQWAANRSGNKTLISRARVYASGGGPMAFSYKGERYSQQPHWTEGEFAPISKALDEYFKDKGMIA